jgi:predicted NUDIX family NTP pyrophosphohydrolase
MKQSAGLLVFRQRDGTEVLLVHPAGPIWGKRDVWSIPKGQLDPGEDPLQAAYREFEEEVGMPAPAGPLIGLGESVQAGKRNSIWAVKGDIDLAAFHSNTFSMEWPPRSGRRQEFPENDRGAWFTLAEAGQKLFPAQVVFLERLAKLLPQP